MTCVSRTVGGLLRNGKFSTKFPANIFCTNQLRNCSNNVTSQENFQGLKELEEIQVPVPWGHISGVWWGPRDKKPIIALHGWQDNANTFKTLLPLMPPDLAVLAIDFPGHGKSSRYPGGMFYYFPDNIVNVRRVVQYFGWKSVGLLGHSMGGIAAFMYAACFPAETDFIMQLDILKPITARKGNYIERFGQNIDSLLAIDKRNIGGSEPPSYEPQELQERLHLGSSKSITREHCAMLLDRGSARAARDPSRYFYTRDYRIVLTSHMGLSDEDVRAMATRISCPHLTVKFLSGSYFESKKKFEEIRELVTNTNEKFEYHEIPGTHHGHLQNAHLVAPIIIDFLKKYKQ